MASHDINAKGRMQTFKNKGKDVDVCCTNYSHLQCLVSFHVARVILTLDFNV